MRELVSHRQQLNATVALGIQCRGLYCASPFFPGGYIEDFALVEPNDFGLTKLLDEVSKAGATIDIDQLLTQANVTAKQVDVATR